MIIVFDLDDTLYDEFTYVKSGFKAVANHLSKNYKIETSENIYRQFVQLFKHQGRGKVFDSFLGKYNLSKKRIVKKCLTVYRLHNPKIRLSVSGLSCLNRLKDYPKFLVTDGNKIVQTKKIKTLKIEKYFKNIIVTHNYGLKHAKPSPYCFHKILKWENANPKELVYIGDNPRKDFINLKKNGFKTVRVMTGQYKDVKTQLDYEADYKINSLDELSIKTLKKIMEY